jgi:hypothetical protein
MGRFVRWRGFVCGDGAPASLRAHCVGEASLLSAKWTFRLPGSITCCAANEVMGSCRVMEQMDGECVVQGTKTHVLEIPSRAHQNGLQPPPDIETEHPIGPVMPPLFAPEAHGKVKRGVLG